MKVLITGANGFIAREIIATLKEAGHDIIACVRTSISLFQDTDITVIKKDFEENLSVEDWMDVLEDVEVVINCVGLFQAPAPVMWKVHKEGPAVLFDACVKQKIKKVIQISALGINKAENIYSKSKLAAEEYLNSLSIDSTILRPSFVYGSTSYGGSSFFRALASLPFFIFLPGKGGARLQPIYIHDLARMVLDLLNLPGKTTFCAVGSEQVTIKTLLSRFRAWLGFKPGVAIPISEKLIAWAGKLGNYFKNAPISTTAVKMIEEDNVATEEEWLALQKVISFVPKGFSKQLAYLPSGVQDRWHARLYFLRPILRISIGFIWIFTGIISLAAPSSMLTPLLQGAGVGSGWLYAGSALDIALGLMTWLNYRLSLVCSVQCVLIIVYMLIISMAMPVWWLHPFAPVAKNIPLLAATFVMMALESSR